MDPITLERVNRAVTSARQFRADAEAAIQRGAAITDAEVATLYQSAESALAERDALVQAYEQGKRADEHDAWLERMAAPKGTTPPNPFSGGERANDPTSTAEYGSAFVSHLLTRKRGGPSDVERATLSIASDGAGGYTVPADHRANILQRLPALSEIFANVTSFSTGRDTVDWPRIRRHGTSGSIYTSAFVGSWIPEVPSASAGQNEPTFGKFKITIEKYRALARVSMDLADDAEFDLMSFLANDGAVNAALGREYAIIAGTGISTEPLGVMNMPTASSSPTEEQILTVDIEGSTSNTISNSTSNAGSAPKLITLFYSLPAQYRRLASCRWVMNSLSMAATRKLIDANGQFLWVPGFAAEPDFLLGKPVVISEFMPSDGSDGNKPILFGALSEIICPVRKDISVSVAPELYMATDEIGLFLHQRMGVGVSNCDALRIGVV